MYAIFNGQDATAAFNVQALLDMAASHLDKLLTDTAPAPQALGHVPASDDLTFALLTMSACLADSMKRQALLSTPCAEPLQGCRAAESFNIVYPGQRSKWQSMAQIAIRLLEVPFNLQLKACLPTSS